jgi:hypothetical protein
MLAEMGTRPRPSGEDGPTVWEQNSKRGAREKKRNLYYGFWLKQPRSPPTSARDLPADSAS